MARNGQSPIQEKPLRRPGSALQKKIIDACITPVYLFVSFPVLMWGMTIGSHFPALSKMGDTIVVLIFTILYECVIYLIYVKKMRPRIASLKLGYAGEVYVGQLLDEMRVNGWLVLHDFQTGHGNIDHIIIAPQGVFTLETKTVSIHQDEENCIYYDCEKIWTNQRNIDSPLRQARAEAGFLADYIRRKLTMNVFVQSVVNYPGWEYKYCGNKTLSECDVWICHTSGLPSVIGSRPRCLKPDEVRRIYNFLASENRE